MDPVGVDPRWAAFGPFHDYLEDAFPLVQVARHLKGSGRLFALLVVTRLST